MICMLSVVIRPEACVVSGIMKNGKGPVWWYPMEKMYADGNRPDEATLSEMKQRLSAELDRLIPPQSCEVK